jgi:hypothetical protein
VKPLRRWNGRDHESRGGHFYVAARSRREAARLLAKATYKILKLKDEPDAREIGRWDRELSVYFSECWGNAMREIAPVVGVWHQKDYQSKPVRIL